MAQRIETDDQPTFDGGRRLGGWRTVRGLQSRPSNDLARGTTVRWPGDGPRLMLEPRDPGLVWVAGLPYERASAELTMRDLLSTWRSAERRLETVPEGGVDWFQIQGQIAALRVAYQRLFTEIRRGLPTG